MWRTNTWRKETLSGKIFPNTSNSRTYPLHLFSMLRPQQWLGKVNSALCKWRKTLKRGSTVRVQVFLAWNFSMVSIPIEGRELTLVSERSLQRQRVQIIHVDTKLRLNMCCSCKDIDGRIKKTVNSFNSNSVHSLTSVLGLGSRHKMQIHLFVLNPHSFEDTWKMESRLGAK